MTDNACARCGAKLADGDVDPEQVARHAHGGRYCGSACEDLTLRGIPNGSELRTTTPAPSASDLINGGTVRLRDPEEP